MIEGVLLTPQVWGILFAVACLAGFIDSIAGGGGLLTLPALLAAGVSPTAALGTNKLQSVGGSFSASLYFVRRGVVDLRQHKSAILLTFIGAGLGTLLVQQLQADFLRQLLPILIISIGLYFLLTPKVGLVERQPRLSGWIFALLAGMGIGFYDGFFGPGAGSFYALAYVFFYGFSLTRATAHAKVLNFTSNFASLLFFIVGGQVVWLLGLTMLAGQFLGARLGASLVLTKGQRLIRPMLVLVSLVMSGKLLLDQQGETLRQWLALWF